MANASCLYPLLPHVEELHLKSSTSQGLMIYIHYSVDSIAYAIRIFALMLEKGLGEGIWTHWRVVRQETIGNAAT